MNLDLIKTLNVANTLGEGVLWDDITETIWWTDIEGKKLFSYRFNTENLQFHELPERLCSFALIEKSSHFLAAFETGLARFDPLTQSLEWIEKIYVKGAGIRLNDGRVDRQGQFWVGGMLEGGGQNEHPELASLFCYSGKKGLSVKEKGILISNSLSWSPDGLTLYFADSPRNVIFAYDVSFETGDIKNKRIFATTPPGVHPDGSCVDAEGYLWNAQWGAGHVVRYAPNGTIDYVLDIPCPQPTCVSFGGANLDHLIVTSARLDMAPADAITYPRSGDLFIYKTSTRGLKEQRFKI